MFTSSAALAVLWFLLWGWLISREEIVRDSKWLGLSLMFMGVVSFEPLRVYIDRYLSTFGFNHDRNRIRDTTFLENTDITLYDLTDRLHQQTSSLHLIVNTTVSTWYHEKGFKFVPFMFKFGTKYCNTWNPEFLHSHDAQLLQTVSTLDNPRVSFKMDYGAFGQIVYSKWFKFKGWNTCLKLSHLTALSGAAVAMTMGQIQAGRGFRRLVMRILGLSMGAFVVQVSNNPPARTRDQLHTKFAAVLFLVVSATMVVLGIVCMSIHDNPASEIIACLLLVHFIILGLGVAFDTTGNVLQRFGLWRSIFVVLRPGNNVLKPEAAVYHSDGGHSESCNTGLYSLLDEQVLKDLSEIYLYGASHDPEKSARALVDSLHISKERHRIEDYQYDHESFRKFQAGIECFFVVNVTLPLNAAN